MSIPNVTRNPFMVLQSNWDEVLWQNNGKAWVYLKHPVNATVHGDITNVDGQSNIRVAEGFKVETMEKHSITLSFPQYCLTINFIAPVAVFSNIHKNNIGAMDVSIGGGLGVSASRDETLVIWDTKSGSVRRKLEGHFGEVECCNFFPSGVVVISGGMDTQMKIWSAEDGTCARTISGVHKRPIRCIAIVDKGRNIISCSADGTVRLWDCGSASEIACLVKDREEINCCSITTITKDLPKEFLCEIEDTDSRSELEVGTENKLLIIGCENGNIEGYHVGCRKQLFSLQLQNPVNCCCFVNDRLVAAGCQNGTIHIIDLHETSAPILTDSSTESHVLSMHPSNICKDQPSFWVGFANGRCALMKVVASDKRSQSLKIVHELTGPDCDAVYEVTEANDGFVYTACRDGSVRKYKCPSS
uniref:Proteasomal ATPase-associated factor 1-like n=1 Tax=Phallusia mammillata TaxID=59560 RepID=A0A6F9DNL0_9ASCI|nr:proteasomal ATPase-associated factor 1-like [Phallusia mammillata]